MKGPKSDIIHKIKIARGQLDGILQMIEDTEPMGSLTPGQLLQLML